MIHGTWSPVTVGNHSQDGQWLSATSAAYGCTCHAQRSKSPMFPTSFTATSAGTCGGQDTKKTPRDEEHGRDVEHPSFFCCSDTYFLWCLQPKQPKLSLGWQLYCQFVGFPLTITTILIYPSIFFLFFFFYLVVFGSCEKLDRRWQRRLIYLLISSYINWLSCCVLCWWCAHHFSCLFSYWEVDFNFLEDIDKSVSFYFSVLSTVFSLTAIFSQI